MSALGRKRTIKVASRAVFDELRDRLERIRLRQRDDGERVPVVADAELAAFGGPHARFMSVCRGTVRACECGR